MTERSPKSITSKDRRNWHLGRTKKILEALSRGEDPQKAATNFDYLQEKYQEDLKIGARTETEIKKALQALPEVLRCRITLKRGPQDMKGQDIVVELSHLNPDFKIIDYTVFVQAVSSGKGLEKFHYQTMRLFSLTTREQLDNRLKEEKLIVLAGNPPDVVQEYFRNGLAAILAYHRSLKTIS